MRGTVFKRCGSCNHRVQKLACAKCGAKSFSWGYRLKVAKKPDGTWQEQWKLGFPTKGAADKALAKQQAAIRENMRLKGNERHEMADGEQRDIYGAYLDADKEAQRQREAEAAFEAQRRQERQQQRAAQKRLEEHRRKLEGSTEA